MAKNNDLTILLTLKGRHLHTLRWLWHANRIGLPYHVIIADGEVHPTIDLLLSDPATFPNLSFEYQRYNDQSFTDFFKKCADAVSKVKTKYIMISDNDDFLVQTGITRSIDFLNHNSDYICAGGKIPSFTIDSRTELPENIMGAIANIQYGYTTECRDISHQLIADRVKDEMLRYQVLYYNTYRTERLQIIFNEVMQHNFSDLTVHEYFMALRATTLGKVRLDPSNVNYIRQTGTSMRSTYNKDWVHHLLRSRLPEDFQNMASSIARETTKIDGIDSNDFKEVILDTYANYLRHMLGHTMMRYRFPGLFKLKQKMLWLNRLRFIPTRYKQRKSKLAFWQALSKNCTDTEILKNYQMNFEEISISLQGDAFLAFINEKASDLQPATS